MSLHPILQQKIDALILRMKALNWIVDVQQGFRSFTDQQKLYDQGRRTPGKIVTNAKPGDSLHNYGLAADVVFKLNGYWAWDENLNWNLLGEEGKKLGLTWGGDFKNLKDRPHFQYTNGLTLDRIKEIYNNGGLTKLWEEIV